MSYADIQIMAIALILIATYSVFMGYYVFEPTEGNQVPAGTNYSSPNPESAISAVGAIISLNVSNPEIFFINSILFSTMAFLIFLVSVRLYRGQG